ncbi:MAG: hypothetical protein IT372_31205 [Polyangiaceae bacterium]|nr:hypothetical protein [Polyangiaceae bacterium]
MPDPARQEAILREIERKRLLAGTRERPLARDAENALLICAFDDRDYIYPTTRAFPLPGGRDQWLAEVTPRAAVPPDHPLFTGEPPDR